MLLIAYKTIVVKELLRFLRIWLQTIFPPVVVTALYLLIFGGVIGTRIGEMANVSYLYYITPGVILMTVITNAYTNAVSSFYLAKFNRSIEEILISPMPNWVILTGFVSGSMARGFVVGIAVSAVSWIFVRFPLPDLIPMFITFFLTTTLFSTAGIINGIFANSFDDITVVPNFILMPLTYLGGMFYDINILSPFWQQLCKLNPIFYMIDSFRGSFTGIEYTVSLSYSIIALVIMNIILAVFATYLLKRRMRLN